MVNSLEPIPTFIAHDASGAISELRRNLAIHDAQRALLAHARAVQTELRFHDAELQRNPAQWACEERARVQTRLAALDEIFADGSIVLSPAHEFQLANWLKG